MNAVVTGGAGFIGHHLVRELVRRGHDVRVLDNLRRGSFEREGLAGARCIAGDIRDADACDRALAGAEVVVHLAAQANVMGGEADPGYCFETNITGVWNVAQAALRNGVAHIIFASSREVYGEPGRMPVAEDAPLRAKNAYGASKIAGEATLAMLPSDGPAVSVLRLANVIGSGDSGRVVPLWIAAARAGEPLALFGGGQQIDFVPVDTVVRCFARLVEGGPVDGPVNVGSGTTTTLPGLAARILDAFPSTSTSTIERRPPRGPEVTRFRADVTRMRALLDEEPPADPLAGLANYG